MVAECKLEFVIEALRHDALDLSPGALKGMRMILIEVADEFAAQRSQKKGGELDDDDDTA